MYLHLAVLAVPSQPINRIWWSNLLDNYAYCISKADRIVRHVGWKEKHVSFFDMYVMEFAIIDNFEKHSTFVLIKPLRSFVDVIICSFIWPAYDHDCHVLISD